MQYSKNGKYVAQCHNANKISETLTLGYYDTVEEAFEAYKNYKENIIKEVAKNEFTNGNITKECYVAMMNYQVEITD